MIDLVTAYQRIDAMLLRYGPDLERASYAISVEVWNYRREPCEPAVSFTASVINGTECIQAYKRPTLADALSTLDRLLEERMFPEKHFGDLRVEIPL